MPDLSSLSLPPAIVGFAVATLVIGVVGTRLARIADRLADVTRLGEAIFGAVLLGASTSLPGIVTSVTAAAGGYAELAFSNAVGGIAAQTVFLVIADMSYSKANLEHAAASVANMMQGALLLILLSAVVAIMGAPPATWFSVHPGSIGLLVAYIFGVRLIGAARKGATWRADRTAETVEDKPDDGAPEPTRRETVSLWTQFAVFAVIIGTAGYVVAETGAAIAKRTGMSQSVVGALFTAVSTSLPELVTAVAAVRQGALTLAVGNIIGGNSFDILFLSFADIAYRGGSLYHAVGDRQIFILAATGVMTGVLLLGLLRREKRGIANIGFESFLVLLLYIGAMLVLVCWP